jgi:hypothetical protein
MVKIGVFLPAASSPRLGSLPANPRAGARTRSWPSPSGIWRAGETLDGEGGYTVWGKLAPNTVIPTVCEADPG